MATPHRPAVTQIRSSPIGLPPGARPRLAKLARRGLDVCRQHGAPLLAEMCAALEMALLDLVATELRARNAEAQARDAVLRMHVAERDLAAARKTILGLQSELALAEFRDNQPTVTREESALIARTSQSRIGR